MRCEAEASSLRGAVSAVGKVDVGSVSGGMGGITRALVAAAPVAVAAVVVDLADARARPCLAEPAVVLGRLPRPPRP